MKQGPRNVKTPMITKTLVLNVLLSASIIIVGTLWVFKREVNYIFINMKIMKNPEFNLVAFYGFCKFK